MNKFLKYSFECLIAIALISFVSIQLPNFTESYEDPLISSIQNCEIRVAELQEYLSYSKEGLTNVDEDGLVRRIHYWENRCEELKKEYSQYKYQQAVQKIEDTSIFNLFSNDPELQEATQTIKEMRQNEVP